MANCIENPFPRRRSRLPHGSASHPSSTESSVIFSVRVFISSTFKDMHVERNALVRRVFPAVDAYCASRGITFIPVDLRWGITEKQSQRGETLAVCLREIEDCRPYFFAMLGQRYGWVPPGQTQSVTHTEIRHGALDQSSTTTRAFFFFRARGLTDGLTAHLAVEPSSAQRQLIRLKQHIRQSGYPLVDGYRSIAAFEKHAYRALRDAIGKDFPPDRLHGDEALSRLHDQFADRLRVHSIRNKPAITFLGKYVRGNTALPLLIEGEDGGGKSAIVATFYREYVTEPGEYVFAHFFGASREDSWMGVAARLVRALSRRFRFSAEIPDDADELKQALFQTWRQAARKAKRLIILLDGMEALRCYDDSHGLSWLPDLQMRNVRMVLSAGRGSILDRLRARRHVRYVVKPLSVSTKRAVARHFLRQYGKRLDDVLSEKFAASRATGNARYLTTLLDELRCEGTREDLRREALDLLKAKTTHALFRKVLIRLQHDFQDDSDNLIRRSLGLLCTVHSGLSENELTALLGHIPLARWSPVRIALSPYLIDRQGVLCITNSALRAAVASLYLSSRGERDHFARLLMRYFESSRNAARSMEELPQLCVALGEWEKLHAVLLVPDNLRILWQRNRFELKSSWAKLSMRTSHTVRDAFGSAAMDQEAWSADASIARIRLLVDMAEFGLAKAQLARLSTRKRLHAGQRETVFNLLGYTRYATGDYRGAYRAFERLLRCSTRSGNRWGQMRALGNLGKLCSTRNSHSEAVDYFAQAEAIARETACADGLQVALHNKANALFEVGNRGGALSLYREQEAVCVGSGNLDGQMASLGCQGAVCLAERKPHRALGCFTKQMAIAKEIHSVQGIQNATGNMASYYAMIGQPATALAYLRRKEAVCRKSDLADALQKTLKNMAALHHRMGNAGKALRKCAERSALCREKRMLAALCDALIDEAEALRLCDRRRPAVQCAQEALAIAIQNGFHKHAARAGELQENQS